MNSHPLYLYVLKPFLEHIDLQNYAVGIINVGMLMSMLIALPFLYLILRHFSLPKWYAMAVAIIIQFLYPQMGRMYGHFEMALAFAFPAYWYFIIRMKNSEKSWIWFILAFLLMLVNGLLAAYLIAINAIFSLALLVVDLSKNRFKITEKKYYTQLAILALVPIFMIRFFVSGTDISPHRPTDPWGFFVFEATFTSVFVPDGDALRSFIPKKYLDYPWGARAFMGRTVGIYFITIVLYLVYSLFKLSKPKLKSFLPDSELISHLAAATLVLLFSFCIPFKYGFEWILDIVPVLKQFRALGRFAWAFYYVIGVTVAFVTYRSNRHTRISGQNWLAYLLLSGYLLISFTDSLANMTFHDKHKKFPTNPFGTEDQSYEQILKDNGYSISDFQGIMTLPFTQTHGDKLLYESHKSKSPKQAYIWAYHTGIPLVQCFAPRISFDQSESAIQLLADPLIPKQRLVDMSEKNLLILVDKKHIHPRFEAPFFHLCDSIASDGKVELYSLQPDKLKSMTADTLSYATGMKDSLGYSNQDVTYLYQDFESSPEGAFVLDHSTGLIIDTVLSDLGIEGDVEISFWSQMDYTHDNLPKKTLKIYDPSGKEVKKIFFPDRTTHNVLTHHYRSDIKTKILKDHRYKIIVEGDNFLVHIDDLLIRPSSSKIILPKSDSTFLYNNYPVDY